MPSIKDESTVEAIAIAFTSNGRNEEQGMLKVGYSKTYARSGLGHRIYSDIRVKQAIARIDAVQAQIGHRTVENIDRMYQAAHDIARTQKNPTAMATNITGIARLYGLDKDNDVGDTPQSITPEQIEFYRCMAQAATKDQVAYLVDMAKADALEILGENHQALELVNRHV